MDFCHFSLDGVDRDPVLADLVAIVNAECRALVEAGADFMTPP